MTAAGRPPLSPSTRSSCRRLFVNVVTAAVASMQAIGLAWVASGCVVANDEVNMSLTLLWDRQPGDDRFSGASCVRAGVERMEWRLIDVDGDEQVEEGNDECTESVLIVDPRPGEYALEITGYAGGVAQWGTRCTGLVVTRFDVEQSCDIPSPGLP
jgi:hypothetical protein